MSWERIYNFQAGTKIASGQVNGELDQLIAAVNSLLTSLNASQVFKLTQDTGYSTDKSGTDLNNLNTAGHYTGNVFTNPPIVGDSGSYRIFVEATGPNTTGQYATKLSSGQRFSRIQTSAGVWTPWIEFLTDAIKTYTNVTLQNSATVFSGRTPRYSKHGRRVTVEGEINGIAIGTTIGTLPVGFRPPVLRIFKVAQNWSTSNNGATIYVNTDGTMVVQTVASTGQSISLMGIIFDID
jgi:hypothetical protein